jgi:hypothetical protein
MPLGNNLRQTIGPGLRREAMDGHAGSKAARDLG